MNRKKLKFIIIISLFIILPGLICLGPACYYTDISGSGKHKFIFGTVINGQYCTGLNIDEANRILTDAYQYQTAVIHTDEEDYLLDTQAAGLSVDYTAGLNDILSRQNPFMWMLYLNDINEYEISPTYLLDEEMFADAYNKLEVGSKTQGSQNVVIRLTDDGYVLEDNKHAVLKTEPFGKYVREELLKGDLDISADKTFYDTPSYTSDEKELVYLFEKINRIQNKKVTYSFGRDIVKIPPYDWACLLCESDTPVTMFNTPDMVRKYIDFEIDEDRAVAYIDDLLLMYNTYNNKYFKTHSGDWVYVKKGNYGNKINIAKEEEWFKEFVNSESERSTRTCEYLVEAAKYKEMNDFGDTFIEISLDEQHLWYYVDGEIFVDTPITSGSLYHGGTDPRVVFVYTKIPNKWLTGPTWHSFVKYWVAIQGAIGIHDASWRSKYGGDEYKYNGSHGCINTPLEAMEKIYVNVEIGTPVIVYSLEKNGVTEIPKGEE